MKKISILLFIGVLAISVNAQKKIKNSNSDEFTIKADPNAGIFEFETETVDYGTIVQNSDGARAFKFTNVGKSPIIIAKAKGSCGCTVPSWPKKPIMPGETAEIEVKYTTSKLGRISKSITLYSNASEKTKIIRIIGNVIKDVDEKSLEKPKSIMSSN
ncbi:MAG: DUF1573 domain-containing protein [Flavobacteriaceae bacterium]|nr:DUF1573 domain-containing protein [Flavobacteriaceae bacterium]